MSFLREPWSCRGGSRTAATSKAEFFVTTIIYYLLTIITKSSILGFAAVLDPPLKGITKF